MFDFLDNKNISHSDLKLLLLYFCLFNESNSEFDIVTDPIIMFNLETNRGKPRNSAISIRQFYNFSIKDVGNYEYPRFTQVLNKNYFENDFIHNLRFLATAFADLYNGQYCNSLSDSIIHYSIFYYILFNEPDIFHNFELFTKDFPAMFSNNINEWREFYRDILNSATNLFKEILKGEGK